MSGKIVTSRMRWCISRVQESFGVDSNEVDEALSAPAAFDALDAVLSEGACGACAACSAAFLLTYKVVCACFLSVPQAAP